MKELLTKAFWRDVKRTFDEARADTIPTGEDSPDSPVEVKADQISAAGVPASPETPKAPEPTVE